MNIVIGVTGSISAYRSYDVVRGLTKLGHQVKVILTSGALEFIKPETFKYLGAKEVYLPKDDFTTELITSKDAPVIHIEIARWCELFILCPLSANTLSKIASGSAQDLLTSVVLSLKSSIQKMAFPAMNPEMWSNPLTQMNRETCEEKLHFFFCPPASGEMVCGEVGKGKLPSSDSILDLIGCFLFDKKNSSDSKLSQKICITAGATISSLDPVRYLTNGSTGILGFYCAQTFLAAGHQVHLIYGKNSTPKIQILAAHPRCKLTMIVTADDMNEIVERDLENKNIDLFISTAAVNDISFPYQKDKIKKSNLGLSITVLTNPDILQNVLAYKSLHNSAFKVLGFAAESPLSEEILEEKFLRKKVDLLIGNEVNSIRDTGFGERENAFWFRDQKSSNIKKMILTKQQLAKIILEWYEENIE